MNSSRPSRRLRTEGYTGAWVTWHPNGAKKAEIEQETGRKLAEREDRRQQERERATQVHEATMAEIGRQNL